MSAFIIELCDAIVKYINGAALSQDTTAVRRYVPKFDLQSSKAFQVQVVPKGDAREMGTRTTDAGDFQVDIGIFKKLSDKIDNEQVECDAAMEFVEELKHVVNRQRLSNVENATCAKIEHKPIYSIQTIDQGRAFFAVLTTTWRAFVAV